MVYKTVILSNTKFSYKKTLKLTDKNNKNDKATSSCRKLEPVAKHPDRAT